MAVERSETPLTDLMIKIAREKGLAVETLVLTDTESLQAMNAEIDRCINETLFRQGFGSWLEGGES